MPAFTPWQTLSWVIQPASMTTSRLSLVIGIGVSRIEVILLPPGESNGSTPLTAVSSVPLASWTAASPAVLPSSRASFQTETDWVPRATRLRAAASPSWPETGTLPARPCASRAATTPPAMPSFSERTASTLLSAWVRNCSVCVWAREGSQLSV